MKSKLCNAAGRIEILIQSLGNFETCRHCEEAIRFLHNIKYILPTKQSHIIASAKKT